ncbi:hypothetical protein RIEGSTA812A_PEG_275 [invertebrate metagenome]|uniref:Uncharacterized protein n=1 Tax=invertebrate metagenome TaxID=1711999 RepID=A0A484HAK6_9ZZZZ
MVHRKQKRLAHEKWSEQDVGYSHSTMLFIVLEKRLSLK